jgi:hypothetical protein
MLFSSRGEQARRSGASLARSSSIRFTYAVRSSPFDDASPLEERDQLPGHPFQP